MSSTSRPQTALFSRTRPRHRGRSSLSSLLAWLIVFGTAGVLHGQSGTATLSGRVVDPDGGRLPAADITLTHLGSNQTRTAISDDQGTFVVDGLEPGPYDVAAYLAGFRSATVREVELLAGSANELEIRLVVALADEIMVTGVLIETTLLDTPNSVAVWRGDKIDESGMRQLEDLYNQSANVYQIANGEGFGMRGINHNSVGTGGGGELGSYSIDGVWQTGFAKRYGPMDMWDVEQVEILRGPQTTNVGRNSLAGAVVTNTKDPVARSEGAVRLGGGNDGALEGALMVNRAIGDHSAFRFAAEVNESDGYVTNTTRGEDDFDARENVTLRAKYLYQPTDRDDGLRFVLTGQYATTSRGNDAVDLANPRDRENTANLDDFEDAENIMVSARIDLGLTDRWSLRSVTSYLKSDYERFDDDDQSPAGGDSFRGRDAIDENWTQDLRFEYEDDTLQGVSGLFFTRVDLDNDTVGLTNIRPTDLGIPSFLAPFYPDPLRLLGVLPATFETTNFALFTRWNWDIDETWSLFGGLRWDQEEQTSVTVNEIQLLTPLPDPTTPGLPPTLAGAIAAVNQLLLSQIGSSSATTDTEYDALLPEIGVRGRFGQSTNASLFYKRGYRAGGAQLSLIGRLNEFDPEFLDNYELSVRSVALDDRLTFITNVYYGDWRDQQVSVQQSDNTFDLLTENAGASEIYGFEIEATHRSPDSGWTSYASLGFAHTEFTEFDSANQGDLSGNRFSAAPEWTAATGATYRSDQGWFVHGDINYQGEAFADVQNTLTLDERTLLNLRVGYDWDRYALTLSAFNVTDEIYAVTAFRNIDGRTLGKVGTPREVLLRFDAKF